MASDTLNCLNVGCNLICLIDLVDGIKLAWLVVLVNMVDCLYLLILSIVVGLLAPFRSHVSNDVGVVGRWDRRCR